MSENRTPRDLTSRLATAHKPAWTRPETLPEPKEQPGWAYRWIRLATLGKDDPSNISSKFREGWEPVKAVDHPELMLARVEDDRYKDNVIIGGLMLCKAPVEMVEERSEYFRRQTEGQMQAVDNNLMRENDPRMPLFSERKTKVTFGNGN